MTIPAGGRGLIKGTGEETSNSILIGDGAKTTLSGVNIAAVNANDNCVRCEGSATILLADKTMNTLSCANSIFPALLAGGTGTTLTIQGKGALKALGGTTSPAIGGGGITDRSCGNIVLEGGVIDARGGSYSTAIGAASGGSCGDITVTDGVTHLVAKRGTDCYEDCIGRSIYANTSCGSVTINGVEYWDGTQYVNGGSQYLNIDALAHLKANEGTAGEYWSTFYYDASDFVVPESTRVFKASLDDARITLSLVGDGIVNSGEGVVLMSSSPYFLMTSANSPSEVSYEDNDLTGTSNTIANPGNAYVLNNKSAGVGFYRLSDAGFITAGKAYLTYSGTQSRDFMAWDIDDATAVESLDCGQTDGGVYYDMQGRRTPKPAKGLYILNGKKVMIR